jgi:hypothetical protein
MKNPRNRIIGKIRLTKTEKRRLEEMTSRGRESARVIRRARILQLLDRGQGPKQISASVGSVTETVRRVGLRYLEYGLEKALFEDARPGRKESLDTRQKAAIIAMICSDPPTGRARWSISLIVTESVKRGICRKVDKETVRFLLLKNELKPWREKSVVHPDR